MSNEIMSAKVASQSEGSIHLPKGVMVTKVFLEHVHQVIHISAYMVPNLADQQVEIIERVHMLQNRSYEIILNLISVVINICIIILM